MAEEHGAIVRTTGVREEITGLDAHRVTRQIVERNMMEKWELWIFVALELKVHVKRGCSSRLWRNYTSVILLFKPIGPPTFGLATLRPMNDGHLHFPPSISPFHSSPPQISLPCPQDGISQVSQVSCRCAWARATILRTAHCHSPITNLVAHRHRRFFLFRLSGRNPSRSSTSRVPTPTQRTVE